MPAGRLMMICRRPKTRRKTTSSSKAWGGKMPIALSRSERAKSRDDGGSARCGRRRRGERLRFGHFADPVPAVPVA